MFSFFSKKTLLSCRYECLCDNKRPSSELKKPDDECNTPCGGDQNRKCGGSKRLTVYRNGVKS